MVLNENSNFGNWKFRLALSLKEKQVSYVLVLTKTNKSSDYEKDDTRAGFIIVLCPVG